MRTIKEALDLLFIYGEVLQVIRDDEEHPDFLEVTASNLKEIETFIHELILNLKQLR